MGIFDFLKGEFIDVIHWTDDTRDTMVWRFEREDHEIKYGAKLTVREGQAAVFVHEGQLADVFTPGLYMLETNNMPIMTLIGIYTTAIAVNLLRGRRSIDCGCGGEPTPLSAWMLLRNVLLVALAVIAGGLATAEVSAMTLVLALPAVLMLWLVYAIANQLLANQGVFRERLGGVHG